MTKRRLGTIQSSRPGYGLLCPKTAYMASHRASFKGPVHGRPDDFHEMAISKNGTGSRARTYDLRFWRPPLYQLSYARIVRVSAQQALPKSFRARCKERSDLIVLFLPAFSIRSEIFVPIGIIRPTAACTVRPARPSPRPASVPSQGRRSRQGRSSSWPAATPIRYRP
jgi:hypothetical protein